MAAVNEVLHQHGVPFPTSQPNNFLDLPEEIIVQIFEELLYPGRLYPESTTGCTNVLRLNKYSRALGLSLFSKHQHSLELDGRGRKIFRHMEAFGRPSFFKSYVRHGQCPLPPKYLELQVLRFPTLCLEVTHPAFRCGFDGFFNPTGKKWKANLQKDIAEVCAALDKSRDLRELRLVLGCREHAPDFEDDDDWNRDTREVNISLAKLQTITQIFKPILLLAKRKDVHLSIVSGEACFFDAYSGRNTSFKDPVLDSLKAMWDQLTMIWIPPPAQTPETTFARLLDYKPIPECQTCWQLFSSTNELAAHVAATKHPNIFRRRKESQLWFDLKIHPTKFVCWTCAMPFHVLYRLEDHQRRHGHYRNSMIPRWKHQDWDKTKVKPEHPRFYKPCNYELCCHKLPPHL